MNRTALALLVAVTACSSARSPATSGVDAAPHADAASAPPGDLLDRAATAICGALFRCCDDDLEAYFAPYAANELLADFRPRLPPMATFDEAGCRDVLEPMLDIVPLGDWVRAAAAGTVSYDPAAAARCLAALDAAECGTQARAALWDSTCFGFAAPVGGSEQRSFVRRTAGSGQACGPLRDGVGAAFYGTCDPAAAFCCFEEAGRTGCQYPFDANGNRRAGHCQAVAPTGGACSAAIPVQLCATGSDCDSDTETCVAPTTTMLDVGARCVDASFHSLGQCRSSFCDLLGTGTCQPLRADGQTCGGGDECVSGRCQSVCIPMDLCTGTPGMPTPDAGVDGPLPTPDAAPDAAPDAPPVMASPETCTGAPTLAASSVASPLSGYTSRVAAAFGASNDYNPLSSSGLPPHCSVVYNAAGNELAYAITLQPGSRLRARAELAGGKQAALYLLNACPQATWPDFDGTGACGSNEYAVGFCGAIGCDPAMLDVRYPTSLGGQPTTTATFWLVVDQVGAADATGFTLDWQLIQ